VSKRLALTNLRPLVGLGHGPLQGLVRFYFGKDFDFTGWQVGDLARQVKVPITDADIKEGKLGDCRHCPAALALARLTDCEPIIYEHDPKLVDFRRKVLIRMSTPYATDLFINATDRKAQLKPTVLAFNAVMPSRQLGADQHKSRRRVSFFDKPSQPKRNPRMLTGMRTSHGSSKA
jgi:hypothetical protein